MPENNYMNDTPTNTLGYLLATLGALVAIPLQMIYLMTVGRINYVDGLVAGVIVGVCIVGGFKLGGGIAKKTFPIYPILMACVSALLGFMLGISVYVYQDGGRSFGDAIVYFFDDYLFAEFAGFTLYYDMGVINLGIAIGIAVLFIGGKRYVQQSIKEGEMLVDDDDEENADADENQ
ncbi:MAG: hypothetical protein FWC71_07375 [Defluviitaleaceae bacterium]|nr:hypothetical protein [Defluviitaleaceae bacterium]